MAVHMTLQCVKGGETYSGDPVQGNCGSRSLDVSGGGTKKSVLAGADKLFSLATQAGWRRWHGGWVCPHCAKEGEDTRAHEIYTRRPPRRLLPGGPDRQAVHCLIKQHLGIALKDITEVRHWREGVRWRGQSEGSQTLECHTSLSTILILGRRYGLHLDGSTIRIGNGKGEL